MHLQNYFSIKHKCANGKENLISIILRAKFVLAVSGLTSYCQ